jgi:hypothetical protein
MAVNKYSYDEAKKYSPTWVWLYHLACDSGYFSGTFQEWLDSLGNKGGMGNGRDGEDGKSAYELSGFPGTLQQWLDSLKGKSAYELSGFQGTEQEWLDSIQMSSDKTYEFPLTLGTSWVIGHGLQKYPSPTLMDSSGFEYECEVQHISNNVCVLRVTVPFSGKIIFN